MLPPAAADQQQLSDLRTRLVSGVRLHAYNHAAEKSKRKHFTRSAMTARHRFVFIMLFHITCSHTPVYADRILSCPLRLLH